MHAIRTKSHHLSLTTLAAAALAATMLAACGGGDDSAIAAPNNPPAAATVQITGLAAIGAAMANATVTATNVRGERATAQTNASGNFTLNVADGAPYILSITDAAGKAWYSYAQAAGVANINPLTTLALLQANASKPLSDLASTWSTRQLTATQVLDAAKIVNANLASVMQGRGINPAATNPFTASFTANGTGLDAVLDAMRVSIACSATACTQTITGPTGSALVNWNANIATGTITLSWSAGGSSGQIDIGLGSCKAPRAGTYSLVVQTTVSGLGGVAIPELCVDGLPGKPATQAEFCGSGTVTQQLPPGVAVLSCSYDGTTGTIAARITNPITLDYSVKYIFVQR
jgi:hypothetical protein